MERRKRLGVYFMLKSLEQGPTFRSAPPKFPAGDPDYRMLHRNRSRYTQYYFYIRDEILGPMAMGVGSFLPFQTTYYINAHHFIAGGLPRQGIRFRKDDNAFLWVAGVKALQAAADRLSPEIIRKRLDYWTLVLGPKFSRKDRAAIPRRREYSLNQVEYPARTRTPGCRNFLFRRNFPIHKIFERSCELGLFRLTAGKIVQNLRCPQAPANPRQAAPRAGKARLRSSGVADLLQEPRGADVRKNSPPSSAWRSASTGSKICA